MAKQWRPEAGAAPTLKKSMLPPTRTQEANAMAFDKAKGVPGKRGYIPSFRQYCAELLGKADERGDWDRSHQTRVVDTIRDHLAKGGTDHPLWVKLEIAYIQAERFAVPELRQAADPKTGKLLFDDKGNPVMTEEPSSRNLLAQRMADAMSDMIWQVKRVRKLFQAERKLTCVKQCR